MAKANQGIFLSRCSQEFVSLGSVHNVWRNFMATGEVTAKKQPPRESMRVLDPQDWYYTSLIYISGKFASTYMQHQV